MTEVFKKEVFKNKEEICAAATELFIEKAAESIEARNKFVVCLSGGSTPELMFRMLAKPENAERVNWKKVHFFWGDERMVPPDDPDSNYGMTNDALLKKIDIPSGNIHRIKGELEPKLSAGEYRAELNVFFRHKQPVFDLCFMGMGDDGHTASLFPKTKALKLVRKRAAEVYVSKLKAWRVTLSAPVLNMSRYMLFMVAGRNKAKALKEVWYGELNPRLYPAQLMRAAENEVVWYLDEALGKAV